VLESTTPLRTSRIHLIEGTARTRLDSDHTPSHNWSHKTPRIGAKDRHTLKEHVKIKVRYSWKQLGLKVVVAVSPPNPHTGSVNNSKLQEFDNASGFQCAETLHDFSLVWLVVLSSYAEIAPGSHEASHHDGEEAFNDYKLVSF